MGYRRQWLKLDKAIVLIAQLEKSDATEARDWLADALQEGALVAHWIREHPSLGRYRKPIAALYWRDGVKLAYTFQNPERTIVDSEDVRRLWGPSAETSGRPQADSLANDLAQLWGEIQQKVDTWVQSTHPSPLRARLSKIHEQRAQVAGIEVLRSGVAGRPTSIHLIESEMERRAFTGELNPVLAAEAKHLREWSRKNYPKAPQLTEKTIKNRLRHRHRELIQNVGQGKFPSPQ